VIHVRWVLTTLLAALGAVTLAACTSGHKSGPERVSITATGRIGPLHVDESDRAAVIAFAGRPESERRGHYQPEAPFDALGYGCTGEAATSKDGVPSCKTVFYLDARTGKLALLYTEEERYVEPHGVHVGTPTEFAARRLHKQPFDGCYAGFRFDTRTGFLAIWLAGGKTLAADHVAFLVVHSRRLNPGVLDCIDS
jgi:hypothetical protein